MSKICANKVEKEFIHLNGYWLGGRESASAEIRKITDNYKVNYLKTLKSLYPLDILPGSPKRNGLMGELTVTIKRDGMYNVLWYDSRSEPLSILCNSPYGRARYNLPLLKSLEDRLHSINGGSGDDLWELGSFLSSFKRDEVFYEANRVYSLIMAGEMYGKADDLNDRPRICDVLMLSRKPRNLADLNRIKFGLFDLISINNINMLGLKYEQRLSILELLFPCDNSSVKVSTIKHFKNKRVGELPLLFEKYVIRKRHEGFVIRNSHGLIFKLKNVHEIDAVIIGYTEAEPSKRINGMDAISSLLVALIKPDGTYQVLTSLKGGSTNKQRIELHTLLSQDIVPSQYQRKSESKKSFIFVKPNHVIQLRFLDMISKGSLGNLVREPCLTLEYEGWKILENVPFLNLINPWFDAFRSQINESVFPSLKPVNPKEPIYMDVKIDQVYPLMKRLGVSIGNNIVMESFIQKIKEGDELYIRQMMYDGLFSDEYLTQEEMQELLGKFPSNLLK